jgi:hypothetical protein
MKEILAFVAALLAVAGNVPYARDTIRGAIQPHPYTWLVWSVVSGITLFGILAKGGGVGAIPVAVSELFTILIFLFALKYGFRHVRRIDTLFLVVALLGLIPWFLTNDPTLSVIVVVGIDVIAFVPTLRKAWADAHTENKPLYASNVARHVLILLSLEAYNVATTLHSVVMIVMNSLMTALLLRSREVRE